MRIVCAILMLALMGCSAQEREADRLYEEALVLNARGTAEDIWKCQSVLSQITKDYPNSGARKKADLMYDREKDRWDQVKAADRIAQELKRSSTAVVR